MPTIEKENIDHTDPETTMMRCINAHYGDGDSCHSRYGHYTGKGGMDSAMYLREAIMSHVQSACENSSPSAFEIYQTALAYLEEDRKVLRTVRAAVLSAKCLDLLSQVNAVQFIDLRPHGLALYFDKAHDRLGLGKLKGADESDFLSCYVQAVVSEACDETLTDERPEGLIRLLDSHFEFAENQHELAINIIDQVVIDRSRLAPTSAAHPRAF